MLPHPQHLRDGIHGVRGQTGNFKHTPQSNGLCHPIRLDYGAVIDIQNGRRQRCPILIYRYESLCMRADAERFNWIGDGARNLPGDALKGLPEFLRRHFGPGRTGNIG